MLRITKNEGCCVVNKNGVIHTDRRRTRVVYKTCVVGAKGQQEYDYKGTSRRTWLKCIEVISIACILNTGRATTPVQ